MSKSQKVITVLCSLLAIVLCTAAILITVLFLQKEESGFHHLQAGGMNLTLTRERLYRRSMNAQGRVEETTDTHAVDFTGANVQNVFGMTAETYLLPGCSFSADMSISSKSEKFSYWLGIEYNGELNELAKQLILTVTVAGEETRSCYLGESLAIGSEGEPLARVTAGSSSFTVRLEFDREASGSGNAQDEWAVFDLIVYAAAIR